MLFWPVAPSAQSVDFDDIIKNVLIVYLWLVCVRHGGREVEVERVHLRGACVFKLRS